MVQPQWALERGAAVGLTAPDQEEGRSWAAWGPGTALTDCVAHRRCVRSGAGGEQADPYSLHAGAAAGAGEGILI